MSKLTCLMGENETLKWTHQGEEFLIHVQQDEYPMSPREDDGNIAILACFHRSYRLGDEIDARDPEEFWQKLVRENVPTDALEKAIRDGKLPGLRLEDDPENKELVNVYAVTQLRTIVGDSEPSEDLIYEGIYRDSLSEYLGDELTVQQCMILMQPYAEWVPMWIYEHGGIAISCGKRTRQFNDQWDSGCLGWAVVLKEIALKELYAPVLDENGAQVYVERDVGNGTMSKLPQYAIVTEDNWRQNAVREIKSEVAFYAKYVEGDVYGYSLYKRENGEWVNQEEDGCWGFFGHDILESGLADEVGLGLLDALEAGEYQTGTASVETITRYVFDE